MGKGILVKRTGGLPEVSTFELEEDTLHQMYRLIGCDTVQMIQIEFEGKEYDMWLDEEGKFKELYPTYPLSYNGEIYDVVVGNVLIMSSNEDGDTIGLSEDVIEKMLYSNFFIRKALEANDYISKLVAERLRKGC